MLYFCLKYDKSPIFLVQKTVFDRFRSLVQDPDTPSELRDILVKLEILYGLWTLEKHLGTFYEGLFSLFSRELLSPCSENLMAKHLPLFVGFKGGYFNKGVHATMIRKTILDLCNEVCNASVSSLTKQKPCTS